MIAFNNALAKIHMSNDVNVGCMAGGTWKRKILDRKGKASQTPGNKKNPATCQTSPFKSSMAKRSRSYKDPEYAQWDRFTRIINHMPVN